GLRDLARAQATRADLEPAMRALAHDGAHGLQVGVETPVGHVVGVADPIAELRALAADVAPLSHDETTSLGARFRPKTQKSILEEASTRRQGGGSREAQRVGEEQ